jgi:uncharacterized protein
LIKIRLRKRRNKLFLLIFLLQILSLSACDNQSEPSENQNTISVTPVNETTSHEEKVIIENKSYLFDVTDHSIEELEALLTRAEEVSQSEIKSPEYSDLEIVMVIHGPDIEWFTHENYQHNRQLIDLAARLDAHDVIDMKVCEQTMNSRGVGREDIPDFIESVPFAPLEIENRLKEGYINL